MHAEKRQEKQRQRKWEKLCFYKQTPGIKKPGSQKSRRRNDDTDRAPARDSPGQKTKKNTGAKDTKSAKESCQQNARGEKKEDGGKHVDLGGIDGLDEAIAEAFKEERKVWPKLTSSGVGNKVGVVSKSRFIQVKTRRIRGDAPGIKNKEYSEARCSQSNFCSATPRIFHR